MAEQISNTAIENHFDKKTVNLSLNAVWQAICRDAGEIKIYRPKPDENIEKYDETKQT